MGEDGAQAERSSAPALPEPSASPEPPGSPGAGEAIRDSSQVNAITVLTLLDKLVHMLDSVQEKQEAMEQRQIELEGSVKGIQGDLSKLCKHHTSTSNAVSKLLEKSRKVSAHTREVRERMDRQCAQVKRLESNHAQLLRRNHFKVLIFQEENEIPASVFAKEPVPSITEGKEELEDENKTLEETLHTVELSSDDEMPHDENGLDDSADEKGESRAEKIKRSSLKKVDSLKKAFSRQNIEKKMNKIGTKIVSAERREKIKKSLTPHHQKSTSKSSSFKVSPLTFNVKKVREGETPAENEEKPPETTSSDQAVNDEETSFTEAYSELTPTTSITEEDKAIVDSFEKEPREEGGSKRISNTIELSIVEDDDEYGTAPEFSSQRQYDERNKPTSGETEQSDEESTQAAVLQIDQTA
ncbi:caveolae-associated protein 2 [Alligator mississippiensis]|uniref:Serum deprivation-response protein n=1 Tax=Alligator mississippiensis TaxID=8496 RepID=A0A151NB14_ALLMI|nr:caveolae-associated protein 2 [Alligator mississippiensis]KYO33685.1 serum deprivation-response protein [Alligator mississippiensis]